MGHPWRVQRSANIPIRAKSCSIGHGQSYDAMIVTIADLAKGTNRIRSRRRCAQARDPRSRRRQTSANSKALGRTRGTGRASRSPRRIETRPAAGPRVRPKSPCVGHMSVREGSASSNADHVPAQRRRKTSANSKALGRTRGTGRASRSLRRIETRPAAGPRVRPKSPCVGHGIVREGSPQRGLESDRKAPWSGTGSSAKDPRTSTRAFAKD